MTTTLIVFNDQFSGSAGTLSADTPDVGLAWTVMDHIAYAYTGAFTYSYTNAATHFGDMKVDGSGHQRIGTGHYGGTYGAKFGSLGTSPDYAVELSGTFARGDQNDFLRVCLRSFTGVSMIDNVAVSIFTGADDGFLYVYLEDYIGGYAIFGSPVQLWKSASGSTGATDVLKVRIELAGLNIRTLVNDIEVDRRMLSVGHVVTAPGAVYLIESNDYATANLLDYIKIEERAKFWEDFVQTYEVTSNG